MIELFIGICLFCIECSVTMMNAQKHSITDQDKNKYLLLDKSPLKEMEG